MSVRCPSPGRAVATLPRPPHASAVAARPKSSTATSMRIRDPDATMYQTSPAQRSYNQYPFKSTAGTSTPRRRHLKTPPTIYFQPTPGRGNTGHWTQTQRPVSPVPATPAQVLQHLSNEAHPAVKTSDMAHVQAWLTSLETEVHSFTSYFLFCEMKFRETNVLATGKETPNHLRTAVAFHCLQQASCIFGRYQSVLDTICQSLGHAIYKDFDELSGRGQPITATRCYADGVTFFDRSKAQDSEANELRDQITSLKHDKRRLERKLQLAQTTVENLTNRGTVPEEPSSASAKNANRDVEQLGTMDKVRTILSIFKTLEPTGKKMILTGLLQSAENPLDADAMADVIQYMNRAEAAKLTYHLAAEFGHSVSSVVSTDPLKAKMQSAFESKEVLEAERASYEQLILLRNELAHAKETYLDDIRHERDRNEILTDELKELLSRQQELSHQAPLNRSSVEMATQTHDDPSSPSAASGVVRTASLAPVVPVSRFQGISELIADANFLPKHIKKIFAKRKPMVVQELCATIATIYQAKMLQDIADDVAGRNRESLIEFMHDLYVLYHGLRGLAIGQFICIDAGVRKFCERNARVRVFGMLLGSSAGPCATYKSIGATHQAVDFYLHVVGLIFQIGHYTHETLAATSAARVLGQRLGDGIVGSPNATSIPLSQALDVVASAFAFEKGAENACYATLKHRGDDGIEIDELLEHVMRHWFKLFNAQVDFMHTLFESMDREQNGIIEFPEFQLLATQLDPQMHERDCLALYSKIAGTNNAIDTGAFVLGMVQHQQRVLQSARHAPRQQMPTTEKGHRHSDVGVKPLRMLRRNSFHRSSLTKVTKVRPPATVELHTNIIGRLRSLSLRAVDAPVKNVESRPIRGSISNENWNVSIHDIIARRGPASSGAIEEGDGDETDETDDNNDADDQQGA
ncbi:hypothetical protein SDRG_11525 [Saprolegnia diclina VS20]|uniref:EF-hand domain-containing protein n=1 Tax=Saprolegnia diclina (strain VS20) TaxID=1156394 RepID=T0PYY2_SAPDV|nr:hypothetical protein SDRG_11525 [Saprolegnia diclina VS20]EQC30764.1 hypothetical protein SDRG_11525 [Saprolegnia diclina VS20]|eukprot:XP_008615788.1 hypothetical protein SDRG_11525 [Saprolegnia diclina VS20]